MDPNQIIMVWNQNERFYSIQIITTDNHEKSLKLVLVMVKLEVKQPD